MKDEEINILIVEDNKIFRDMLAEKLGAQGYKIFFLTSEATIDNIRKYRVDLAIINITNPKEKGLKLIEEMSKDEALSKTPIMIIAKTEGSVLVDYAKEYGVKYMIDKALFDSEEMLENVNHLLSNTQDDELKNDNHNKNVDEKKVTSNSDKGTVLLVEDDVFMRELFAKNLRDAGFKVFDAEDAIAAEKVLKDMVPDVVLLDLLLPGKSGFQFLSETKHKEKYSKIPIIVVSNLGSKGDIDRALDLGAADFLVKANATIDEIVKKAGEHINKSKRTPHLPESIINGDSV